MAQWITSQWIPESQASDTGMEWDTITIHRMVSPFYAGPRFAVRRSGRCLNGEGQWEWEPQPSSRDDAFYRRCRFLSFTEARVAAERAMESPNE